jgi:hypothetical protein
MPESRRDYDRTLLTDAAGVSTLIASLAASRPGNGRERWMLTATAGVALAAQLLPSQPSTSPGRQRGSSEAKPIVVNESSQ